MKALQGKNRVLWLVALVAVLSAIAIYRIGFHIPVPGFSEEAVTSLKQGQSQEGPTQPNPNGAEPAASVQPPDSVLPPSHAADLRQEQLTQRLHRSEHPLYFRVAFGAEGSDSMLGILDESGGTGTGYNAAYVDENMNGNLTDEAAKRFSRLDRGSRAGELDPRFEFTGPFKGAEKAKYTLDIYSLAYRNRKAVEGNDYYFCWFLDVNQWHYFFINGQMKLFSNPADAGKGPPVRLGGPCKWEISSRTQDGKPMISAGLKDENGCTLRIVRRAGETISPTLTLTQDGQVKAQEKMKFG